MRLTIIKKINNNEENFILGNCLADESWQFCSAGIV